MHLCIQYTRKRNIQAAKLWAKILREKTKKIKCKKRARNKVELYGPEKYYIPRLETLG